MLHTVLLFIAEGPLTHLSFSLHPVKCLYIFIIIFCVVFFFLSLLIMYQAYEGDGCTPKIPVMVKD